MEGEEGWKEGRGRKEREMDGWMDERKEEQITVKISECCTGE